MEAERYQVEMTEDHLMAVLAMLNLIECLDGLLGDSPERRTAHNELKDLLARYRNARTRTQEAAVAS